MDRIYPKISIATLVVCTRRDLDQALHLAGRTGIVVEVRKHDARVQYLDPDRSAWLPLEHLHPPSEERGKDTRLAIAALAVQMLCGVSLEAASSAKGMRIVVGHGGLTPEVVDRVRAGLGAHLASWVLRPAGLHRIESSIEIEWRTAS